MADRTRLDWFSLGPEFYAVGPVLITSGHQFVLVVSNTQSLHPAPRWSASAAASLGFNIQRLVQL